MSNVQIQHGDLLHAPVEALVNTVNCVGVMGKGIALQFHHSFPENSQIYKAACKAKTLRPGSLLVVDLQITIENPQQRFIINFATKDHWRSPSRIEWIEEGLHHLVEEVRTRGIYSIAIPPLGSGNGGLNWKEVRPLIENAFAVLPHVQVWLYPPEGAPDAATMAPAKAPRMTLISALTIEMLSQYSVIDLEFSQLELQKLIYLLQSAGEPLPRLHFEKMRYGPAAAQLFPMLGRWENHWTVGFGDGTGGIRGPVLLKPEAVELAHAYLKSNPAPESELNVDKVMNLIQGLDTMLGLELLSSVHWIARHYPDAAHDPQKAVEYVHLWNEHKRNSFPDEYIHIAWKRLEEQGWLQNLRPEWMRFFECENVEDITKWVNAQSEMQAILMDGAKQIRKFFPNATLRLMLWTNQKTGLQELALQIKTQLSTTKSNAQMEQFNHAWWSKHSDRLKGIFSISLD